MKSDVSYRECTITYDPPPVPFREMDYHWVHDEYDGAPIHSESDDGLDNRCGSAASVQACKDEIDEMYLDEEEANA